MPGIAHVIVGLAFIIPWFIYTRNQFNYKVAFIFVINNYLGPDAAWVLDPLVGFHNLFGFAVFAIPLALLYSYMSRFSLERSAHFVHFIDGGIREVSWKNAYLLVVAGGICHFLIDTFFHLENELDLLPGISLAYTDILTWDGIAYHDFAAVTVLSWFFVLASLLAVFYCLKKGSKETLELLAVVTIVTATIVLSGGGIVLGGERDIAASFFGLLFIFTPLLFIAYVARDVREHPRTQPDVPKVPRTTILKAISGLLICISVLFLVVAVFAILQPLFVVNLIGNEVFPDTVQAMQLIQTVASLILGVASVLLVCSIGLLFKKPWSRGPIVGFTTGLLVAAAFPFAMALFLSEKDVRVKFARETTPSAPTP